MIFFIFIHKFENRILKYFLKGMSESFYKLTINTYIYIYIYIYIYNILT